MSYNTIPRELFHNALINYFNQLGMYNLKISGTNTMTVYEIARQNDFELHITAQYEYSSDYLSKFHFTLRRGEKKGIDAFIWYKISGSNKHARLQPFEVVDQSNLLSSPAVPETIRYHLTLADEYAKAIFAKAVSYTFPNKIKQD
jgi:hypothetical protein